MGGNTAEPDGRNRRRYYGEHHPDVATSLLARLRPTVTPTDRLTVTGREPDSRVYAKRKHTAISRADVTYAEYFQPMEVE